MESTYKIFNESSDVIKGKTKKKTYPLWSDLSNDVNSTGESTLTSFYLKASETGSNEGRYYYNIYNNDTNTYPDSPVQFSLSFGTTAKLMYSSSNADDNYIWPSYATYKAMYNLLEGSNPALNGKFEYQSGSYSVSNAPTTMSMAYFVVLNRDRIKNGIEQYTFQLNLSGTLGALTITDDKSASVGSKSVTLYSGVSSLGYTTYNGIAASTYGSKAVGLMYPEYGILVLDAAIVSSSCGLGNSANGFVYKNFTSSLGFSTGYEPFVPLKHVHQLFFSGSYFLGRTTEIVNSTHYFCRLNHNEFNYSTNPTWVSGSSNTILDAFYDEPKTFVTAIGLYDGDASNGTLVAIAKLSRPIEKNTEKEFNIDVRLDY